MVMVANVRWDREQAQAERSKPMDPDGMVALFLEAATLKRLPRSGWLTRGIPDAESVAEHSFGVVLVALALADALVAETERASHGPTIDLERVLAMAVLHDLAEVRLTDLPDSAQRLIPGEVKRRAETAAVEDLLRSLPRSAVWQKLWQEFENEASPEAQLVHDADKLEMMVQCLSYEQAGQRGLEEFWATQDRRSWHYPLSAELYGCLRTMRPGC
jgi:putative hydrolase of HD superfamily